MYHRDVKPINIVMDDDMNSVMADFVLESTIINKKNENHI